MYCGRSLCMCVFSEIPWKTDTIWESVDQHFGVYINRNRIILQLWTETTSPFIPTSYIHNTKCMLYVKWTEVTVWGGYCEIPSPFHGVYITSSWCSIKTSLYVLDVCACVSMKMCSETGQDFPVESFIMDWAFLRWNFAKENRISRLPSSFCRNNIDFSFNDIF